MISSGYLKKVKIINPPWVKEAKGKLHQGRI